MTNGQDAPLTLGRCLRARQRDLGINQSEAAVRCGVSRHVYSRWLNEVVMPSMGNIEPVALFLGIKRGEVLAMMPDSFQFKAIALADVETMRAEIADLRKNDRRRDDQIKALRKVVDRLTSIVESVTPKGA